MDEQPEVTKFVIVGDYLCEDVGGCTCGSYSNLYAHEQYCGIEPIVSMDEIKGLDKYIKYEYKPVITITGLSDELKTEIYMALGGASTCWIPDTGSAVFDSTRAEKIANELIEKIEKELRSGV